MSGSFNEDGVIRIDNGAIITIIGKKRSGKTALGLVLGQDFDGDMIVIDPAGDDGPTGPGVYELRGAVDELPTRFPEHARERPEDRVILHYVPDAGSPTHLQDMDRVVGMAFAHSTKERPAMLIVHESGVLAPVHKTQPHTRRVLNHNRHRGLVCVFTMPRPKTVDPLLIGQADLVYIFELPNADDRDRIAETVGWSKQGLHMDLDEIGPHEYLRFDTNEQKVPAGQKDYRLMWFPALPADLVRSTLDWSQNVPRPADSAPAGRSPARP